jgi:hypothetical protein
MLPEYRCGPRVISGVASSPRSTATGIPRGPARWTHRFASAVSLAQFYAIDGETFRTRSANFSTSGENTQLNDLHVICDPKAVATFDALFERMWEKAQPMKFAPAMKALDPLRQSCIVAREERGQAGLNGGW